MGISSKENIIKILNNQTPSRFVYAPNYWQWFSHHKNHGILPDEIKHCENQLDLLNFLGVDVFSRNIYSRQEEYWFGGICEEYFEDVITTINSETHGRNKITEREYHFKQGILSEKLEYLFDESTIVQKEFLIKDYISQTDLLEQFVSSRKWRFNKTRYEQICTVVGESGIVIAGEFFSPLKMLHMAIGPVNSVYFLMEQPELSGRILALHEAAQLDLVRECVVNGVSVIMSMDNLDTMFHPPDYVEAYSASFYEKASAICHEHGSKFFIHACGNQKDNLKLINSFGVDGLEGFAFPPLGDIELEDAMKITSDDFILTGGISAMETRNLKTRKEVFRYVENLFKRMSPYKNRFVLSSSCNTSIDARWDTIKDFRDAWLEYRDQMQVYN